LFPSHDRYNITRKFAKENGCVEVLWEDLIIEAGFFSRRTNLEGDEVKKAKSISFSSMDEYEFNQLYDAVINVIIKHFKFEKRAIEENLIEFY